MNVEIIGRDEDYSTSKIKELILKNKFNDEKINQYHGLLCEGLIVRGNQLGRTLAFPTANIIMKTEFPFINGSYYYSNSIIDNKFFDSMSFICSKKNNAILIETFIFDFNQNIYGKRCKLFLWNLLEKKKNLKI